MKTFTSMQKCETISNHWSLTQITERGWRTLLLCEEKWIVFCMHNNSKCVPVPFHWVAEPGLPDHTIFSILRLLHTWFPPHIFIPTVTTRIIKSICKSPREREREEQKISWLCGNSVRLFVCFNHSLSKFSKIIAAFWMRRLSDAITYSSTNYWTKCWWVKHQMK
jgi:hypothetical protein